MIKTEEERTLRRLLWLRHGCEITDLYGDDGEMQCSKCLIDFKDDPVDDICKKFAIIAERKLKKEADEAGKTVGQLINDAMEQGKQCQYKISRANTVFRCVKDAYHSGNHSPASGRFDADCYQKYWSQKVYCDLCEQERKTYEMS